jgi:hypothetical protein
MASEPAYMVTPAGDTFAFMGGMPYPIEVAPGDELYGLAEGYYDEELNLVQPQPEESDSELPPDIDDYDDL